MKELETIDLQLRILNNMLQNLRKVSLSYVFRNADHRNSVEKALVLATEELESKKEELEEAEGSTV